MRLIKPIIAQCRWKVLYPPRHVLPGLAGVGLRQEEWSLRKAARRFTGVHGVMLPAALAGRANLLHHNRLASPL